MLWWNIFTVLDVLLLLLYDQLRNQLGPQAVFYVNNVIWFLGLDIYHLYFTFALWTQDIPSIKEVPQKIPFYPLQPTNLEPRRPKQENSNTANVCAAQAPNPDQIEEPIFEELCSCDTTCEFQSPSLEKRPGWKGKGGRKITGQIETKAGDNEKDMCAKTNFTYIFKRPVALALPTVSD